MQNKQVVEEFIKEVRSYQPSLPPAHLREMVVFHPTERGDQHAVFRWMVLYALLQSFSLEDRAFIRFLLEQEITYHTFAQGFSESIKIGAFLLFILAEPEDIQLLWKAKTTSFDIMCGLDDQLLLGAGLSVTLEYLQRAHEPWSERARKYIEKGYPYSFEQLKVYRDEMQKLLTEHMKIMYKRWEKN